MAENKIISAIRNQVGNTFENIDKKIRVDADTEGAIREIKSLIDYLDQAEQQLKNTSGESYTRAIQETFSQARSQIQEYMNFMDSVKDQLDFSHIADTASRNLDALRNKFNEFIQSLNQITNTSSLDDITSKLSSIKDIDFDISDNVRKFNNQLDEMARSVENLKQNIESQIQLIDFSNIGGNNVLNDLDRKLSDILSRVQSARNEINNEVSQMISPENLETESIINKLDSFVNEVKRIGQDINEVSSSIKTNFRGIFDELTDDVGNNTINMLEKLSDLITSLNNNNITINNPLGEIIESLKSLNEQDVMTINNISNAINSMFNLQIDSGRGTIGEIANLTSSIQTMKNTMDEALQTFRGFIDTFNNGDAFSGFNQQLESIRNTIREIDGTVRTSTQVALANQIDQSGSTPGVQTYIPIPPDSSGGSYGGRPDQFYASADALKDNFFNKGNAISLIDEIRNTQHELGRLLWSQYQDSGGEATRQKLIENNEIEALLNTLKSSISGRESIINTLRNVSSGTSVALSDSEFNEAEQKIADFTRNIERLVVRFANMAASGADEDVIATMMNRGSNLISEFESVLSEIPAELRNTLQSSNIINDFQNVVKQYNANLLEQAINSSSPDDYIGTNVNEADFFARVLGQSNNNIGKLNQANDDSLFAAMQAFNRLDSSGYYDDGLNLNYSPPNIRRRMIQAGNANQEMLNQHENLLNAIELDDHNLIMRNALRFLNSGIASMSTTSGVGGDIASSIDRMGGDDANQALEVLRNLDQQAIQTGESVRDIVENIIRMMEIRAKALEGDERSTFEKQLDTIKERLELINNEMERSRMIQAEVFSSAVSSGAKTLDFESADQDVISQLYQSSASGYRDIESRFRNLRLHANQAKLSNMSGSFTRQLRRGNLSNDRLDDIYDLAREAQAQMSFINKLMNERDEAFADPERREEAIEKQRAVNEHQMRLSRLSQQLQRISRMSDDDLKDAPPEIKNVYDNIKGIVEYTKDSNLNTAQLNEMLGLDEFNDELLKANNELDRLKNSKLENLKNEFRSIGDVVNRYIGSPLKSISGVLNSATGLIRGGMGALGLGALSGLIANPLSLSGASSILGTLVSGIINPYIQIGREQANMRQFELNAYGTNADAYGNIMYDRGIEMEQETFGRIKAEDLTGAYQTLMRNVQGQYGQADSLAQRDMANLSETLLLMQQGWGISEGQAANAINVFYKELGMNVREAEYELAKIGQTAQSLNVPYEKMLESVTSLSMQYRNLGFHAGTASNVMGNIMFQHEGITAEQAFGMAQNVGSAIFNQEDGWVAYGAMMAGMHGDPLQAIVDLQYGFNDDGTYKDGVLEDRVRVLQDRYRMMKSLGGSAGEYAFAKTLEQSGFSRQEVARFLNNYDDDEYIANLLMGNAQLTTDLETGETISKDDPDAYFQKFYQNVDQAADRLSEIDQLLATWESGMKEIAFENNELLNSMLDWDESLSKAIGSLGEFVGGIDSFVNKLQEWFDRIEDSPLGNMSFGDMLLGGLGLYAGSKILSAGARRAGGSLARRMFERRFNRDYYGNSTYRDDDPRHPNHPNNPHTLNTPDTSKRSWRDILRRVGRGGGMLGLAAGGATLLGGLLFNEEASAMGFDSIGGSQTSTLDDVVQILGDIYNVLTGGQVSASTVAGGGTLGFGGQWSLAETTLAMSGLGMGAGALMSLVSDRHNVGGALQHPVISSRREQVVAEEEAASRQRIREAYERNRSSGQNASEALRNARREEDLRTNSAFYRATQEDYEELFKNYKDPTTTRAKLGRALRRGASSALKPIPLLGTAASIGLGAWEISDQFDDIDALSHMTGYSAGREKTRAIADLAGSGAIVGAGAALGTLIPIPVLGTLIGAGVGMAADWGLEKMGAKEWLADLFGIGQEDIERSKRESIGSNVYDSAMSFKSRMSSQHGLTINDDVALIAAGAVDRNSGYLKGYTQEEKDAWSIRFTEEYLAKIAEGVDPAQAEKLAKEQADKLLEIQLGTEEVKELNREQLFQMLELYELTGANKDELVSYKEQYFERESEAREVLNATSEATGLSYEELVNIGLSLELLPAELAALISMASGGNVEGAFLQEGEIEQMRRMLSKNSGLSNKAIEDTIAFMIENSGVLAAQGLNKDEMNRYAQYFASTYNADYDAIKAAEYAEKVLLTDIQAEEVLTGGGLADKVLGYQKSLGHDSAMNVAMSISKSQRENAIAATASASGMTEWQIKNALGRLGVDEHLYTRYLLDNFDSGDGILEASEISSILGDKNSISGISLDERTARGTLESTTSSSYSALEERLRENNNKLESSNEQSLKDGKLAEEYYESEKEYKQAVIKYNEEFDEANETFEKQNLDLYTSSETSNDLLENLISVNSDEINKIQEAANAIITAVIDGSNNIVKHLTGFNSTGTSGLSFLGQPNLQGNSNAEKIWNFLKQNGFSDAAAAAVIGNFQQENGTFDPTKGWDKSTGPVGIAQWLGGRREGLVNFANEKGMDPQTLEAQLAFFIHEIENKEKGSLNRFYSGGWEDFKRTDDLESATVFFRKGYERPGEHEALDNKRIRYASDALASFSGREVLDGTGGGDIVSSADVAQHYIDLFKFGTPFAPGVNLKNGWHSKGHMGLDLNVKGTSGNEDAGTPIASLASGKVTKVTTTGGFGNRISILGDDGREYTYAHLLEKPDFRVGDRVGAGDVVGQMGSSGRSSAAHLHLEITENGKHIDPAKFLQDMASGNIGAFSPGMGSSGYASLLDASNYLLGGAYSAPSYSRGGTINLLSESENSIKSLEKAIEENTESTEKNTESTEKNNNKIDEQNPSIPRLTNISAYDPFSGIHPTSNLDYNGYVFDIYKDLESKGISYNEAGVNLQEMSKEARSAFDINIKSELSVDPTKNPNFTYLLDRNLKQAVQDAVNEAVQEIDSNYNQQFMELWNVTSSTVNINKSID